jgi:hypothetical protein
VFSSENELRADLETNTKRFLERQKELADMFRQGMR